MGSIVVCGGGVVGLATAMMLGRDGHQVTVLESDPTPVPASALDAWDRWDRSGVAQFRQPHNLFPRFRSILEHELPGMVDALLAEGCVWVHPTLAPPPSIEDRSPRPDDDRFSFVTGRRPAVELAFARAAETADGVTVRRGVRARGLVAADDQRDVLDVGGVVTFDGQRLEADLVVDAMGRRSPVAGWLQEMGGRSPVTESADCGFVYYTRYFAGPELPQQRAGTLARMGTISVLTLPGDNGTWSVTVFGASRDTPLKQLRDAEVFNRVIRACPAHAHWLDGEPMSAVLAMAGVLDRYHRYSVDGRPLATGLASVGDAWACTNPSAGRGLSVGLIQAQQLRRVVQEHLDDRPAFAAAWDAATEAHVTPYYRSQIAADRVRLAEMDALRDGRPPPPPDPLMSAFFAGSGFDADLFRALIEVMTCMALLQDVLDRPGMRAAIMTYADRQPGQIPGPDRQQLVSLLTG